MAGACFHFGDFYIDVMRLNDHIFDPSYLTLSIDFGNENRLRLELGHRLRLQLDLDTSA